ncbi:MAG: fasciclin domain-containing protein [Betaproteobacteria bacterium]|nr:MAG: fasciclin domain-containing protein [Betaproteobacteria bacterium]
MSRIKILNFAAVLAFATSALVFSTAKPVKADVSEPATIVDIAVAAGYFDTLVVALKEAGLVETLAGEGPFTVFAPTDEAFARIPADQLSALLTDKEMLTRVLTYHVVPGTVMAADVKTGEVKTVEGSTLTISTRYGVKVDDANVIKTDIVASNGVIHVIDSVVLPN